MNTLILFALLAYALGAWVNTGVYNDADCSGDIVTYASVETPGTCTETACVTAGINGYSWSTKVSCTDSWNELPENAVGWATFPREKCAGDPTAAFVYGNQGCVSLKGIAGLDSSYKLECADGRAKYSSWLLNSDNCEGNPTAAVEYDIGCTTVGVGNLAISTSQIGCGGVKPDNYYTVYLDGWLNWVEQNWVVPAFDAAEKCFRSHAEFEVNDNTVSVDVVINTCTDDEINAFVDKVCEGLQATVNAGICINADCAGVDVYTAACTWTRSTKRNAEQTTITIGGQISDDGNSPSGSASGLVFPLAALMLSVLALVF